MMMMDDDDDASCAAPLLMITRHTETELIKQLSSHYSTTTFS